MVAATLVDVVVLFSASHVGNELVDGGYRYADKVRVTRVTSGEFACWYCEANEVARAHVNHFWSEDAQAVCTVVGSGGRVGL